MRKICTVLFLNLLRSTRHSKVVVASLVILGVLTVTGLSLGWQHFGESSLALHGQPGVTAGDASQSPTDITPRVSNLKQRASANDSKPSDVKSKVPSVLQPTPSAASSEAQASAAPLLVKSVSLDTPTPVCRGQQNAYTVQSAQVSLDGPATHASGTIRWYWETRVDGAEATDNPPLNNQINTLNVPAGSAPVVIESGSPPDPLVTAPTSSTYSYSFRLHIVGSSDVMSDWASIPLVLDNNCRQQQ